jgi:hypothetical protein
MPGLPKHQRLEHLQRGTVTCHTERAFGAEALFRADLLDVPDVVALETKS